MKNLLVLLAVALSATACGSTTEVSSADDANIRSIPYRLLAENIAEGEPYTARRVIDPGDASPGVGAFEYDDPPSEVFFEFVLAESSSCPFGSLERLEFDRTTRLLYPVVEESSSGDCTADANPHLVFVAVRRADLPSGAFAISVGAEGWPNDFEPVAFADGELTRPKPDSLEHPVLDDPATLAVGEGGILVGYSTHCDASYLWWVVDGRRWARAGTTRSALPADWKAVERDDQVIDLVITRTEPDRIDAVARGAETVVSFVPDPEGGECM